MIIHSSSSAVLQFCTTFSSSESEVRFGAFPVSGYMAPLFCRTAPRTFLLSFLVVVVSAAATGQSSRSAPSFNESPPQSSVIICCRRRRPQ